LGKIRVLSGNWFDFNSESNTIVIGDIAAGLARACRFGGQLPPRIYYSVAEHSILCVEEAIKRGEEDYNFLLALLLHDSSEAYCGDVVKPLKNIICDEFSVIEDRIQRQIGKTFNVDFDGYHDRYKWYDIQMYEAESSVLFNEKREFEVNPRFPFWSFEEAESKFIEMYKELTNVEATIGSGV
jgi:5'-deoxynucleotidase YfbR-like HD superfamily hydrolase